jgi:DNA repair protein RadC
MTNFTEVPTAFACRTAAAGSELSPDERAVIRAARDIVARHLNRNPVLSSWQALLDYCALAVRGDVEQFHVLYLDRKNRLIADIRTGTGTVDHVPVYPREVLRRALGLSATALILVHNHPAGDPDPSAADIAMTKEVAKACRALGITLHDHIITGGGREVSLRARGLL